jgi:hypothetical protein
LETVIMSAQLSQVRRPRCFLVYALAPEGLPASEANRIFNEFIADKELPLAVFHDHFIGHPGGIAIFYVESPRERDALLQQEHLRGWRVEYGPMVFAHSPAAFDEQIAFTLRAYRSADWEQLQRVRRPKYGSAAREAETAQEDETEG